MLYVHLRYRCSVDSLGRRCAPLVVLPYDYIGELSLAPESSGTIGTLDQPCVRVLMVFKKYSTVNLSSINVSWFSQSTIHPSPISRTPTPRKSATIATTEETRCDFWCNRSAMVPRSGTDITCQDARVYKAANLSVNTRVVLAV